MAVDVCPLLVFMYGLYSKLHKLNKGMSSGGIFNEGSVNSAIITIMNLFNCTNKILKDLQCRPEICVLRRRKTHARFLRTRVFKCAFPNAHLMRVFSFVIQTRI